MMTEPRTIRWGIAGAGGIARQFAADMAYANHAALAAVCARDSDKARAFADAHAGVLAFGRLSEMIASDTVDAVYVATPNAVHRQQALECIAAGMPVLVEKPLTANLDGALEIQAAARAAQVFAMEAMWSRYLPAMKSARRALRDGAIGTVRSLEADIGWKMNYDPASRFFDAAQGGGALYDIGVYAVSLARFLLGEPGAVGGSWRAAPSGVDVSATIDMSFGDASAKLECGFDRARSNRMMIEGDRGVMVLGPLFIKADGYAVYPSRRLADLIQPGGDALISRILRKSVGRMPLPGVMRSPHRFAGGGLQFEIEAASDAIRQGLLEEPDNRLDDSIATLRILNAILDQSPART